MANEKEQEEASEIQKVPESYMKITEKGQLACKFSKNIWMSDSFKKKHGITEPCEIKRNCS